MEMDLDDIITELYFNSIIDRATIKLLTGMITGVAEMHDPIFGATLRKEYDKNLPKMIEEEFLQSKIKDSILEHFSNDTLKKFMDQLGLKKDGD